MEEQYQELAKYIGGFYPDMDVETIRKSLIEDPDKLDRAIKKLHQDKNRNWDYDEFKQAYISQYGQKKKDGGNVSSTGPENESANAQDAVTLSKKDLQYSWNDPAGIQGEQLSSGNYAVHAPVEESQFNNLPQGQREEILKELEKGNKQAEKDNQVLSDRVAYDRLKSRRNGNYVTTGDQLTAVDQYTSDRNKRLSFAERQVKKDLNYTEGIQKSYFLDENDEIVSRGGKELFPKDQKTLAEYEHTMGLLHQDMNDLTGAIPHLERQVKEKFGDNVFLHAQMMLEEIQKYDAIPEPTKEDIEARNGFVEKLQGIQNDPVTKEYFAALDLYQKNIDVAKKSNRAG
jgi:hypothetical protein